MTDRAREPRASTDSPLLGETKPGPFGWQLDGSYNPCPECFTLPDGGCAAGGHETDSRSTPSPDHEHEWVVTERNFTKYPHHIRYGCAVDACDFDTFRYLHAPPGHVGGSGGEYA